MSTQRTDPVCVKCGKGLEGSKVTLCDGCSALTLSPQRVLDLVGTSSAYNREREHYDRASVAAAALPAGDEIQQIQAGWRSAHHPVNGRLLERLAPIVPGRRVLAVGNGASAKELEFLRLGASQLILTDLSVEALRLLQGRFPRTTRDQRLALAAMDATSLPIADDAIDIVYGYAFVHHLNERRSFLADVYRVLRPGGTAIFMDDAYSPLWQWVKLGPLRPLMTWFHRRGDPSPEDRRATLEGGFRPEVLEEEVAAVGGHMFAERSEFLHYFASRFMERARPRAVWLYLDRSDTLHGIFSLLDMGFCKVARLDDHQIRLIWGFTKPAH